VSGSQPACGDIFLKLDKSLDRSARSSVKLTDGAPKGELSQWTGDGPVRLELTRLTVQGPAEVPTEAQDDYLRLVDSIFAHSVSLDGGAGRDTVQRSRDKFAIDPLLLNRENVKR
jgi:hypothetical protein